MTIEQLRRSIAQAYSSSAWVRLGVLALLLAVYSAGVWAITAGAVDGWAVLLLLGLIVALAAGFTWLVMGPPA